MAGVVSVVVTAHQRRALLPRLLDLLLADEATREVVIVADGCTDGTQDEVRSRAALDARVCLIDLEDNVGQPRARAIGVQAAEHEVVLSLDDDVVPSPGLVTGHARRHQEGDADVVVGYMPTHVATPRVAGLFATVEYSAAYEEGVARWQEDPESILTTFWAGNISFSRDRYLRAVDGDDLVALYHEDAHLGLLLQRAGGVAVFAPELVAQHRHSRRWDAYLCDAASAGRARVLLGRRWPQERPYDPEAFFDGLPRPVRLVAAVARGGARLRAALLALRVLNRAAGVVRSWPYEDRAALLAKELVVRDAALQELRRPT